MTLKEYKKYKESELIDRRVKCIEDMSNVNWFIPRGTILKITRKYAGFELETIKRCPYCEKSMKFGISRVPPEKVELI